MKIIKRNGAEESFDTLKIVNAVQKACNATENAYLAPEQLTDIADYVEYKCNKLGSSRDARSCFWLQLYADAKDTRLPRARFFPYIYRVPAHAA